MTVADSYDILMAEEADKLLDEDKVIQTALDLVQQNGIVFLDEVDKIAVNRDARGGDVSREGVQRDLLPLNRRDNRDHQTWHGKNRPYFIYR